MSNTEYLFYEHNEFTLMIFIKSFSNKKKSMKMRLKLITQSKYFLDFIEKYSGGAMPSATINF